MNTCAYCDANALFRDRGRGVYLCPNHSRIEVTGPKGEAPRPPLTIRPAMSADRTRIVEILNYFWGEVEVECFGRSYRVDELPATIAADGDEIVGIASYAIEENAVNLVLLNVLPRWQGRRVAHELIATVIEIARDESIERLIVATTNDDLPALGLYQRLGFVITQVLVGQVVEHHGGIELGFADIPIRDEIQLELRL